MPENPASPSLTHAPRRVFFVYGALTLLLSGCSPAPLTREDAAALINAKLSEKPEVITIKFGAKLDPKQHAPVYEEALAIGQAVGAATWAIAAPVWQVGSKAEGGTLGKHNQSGIDLTAFYTWLSEKHLVQKKVGDQNVAITRTATMRDGEQKVSRYWVVVPDPSLGAAWDIGGLYVPLCTRMMQVAEVTGVAQEELKATAEATLRSVIAVKNDNLLIAASENLRLGYGESVARCRNPSTATETFHFQRYDDGWRLVER